MALFTPTLTHAHTLTSSLSNKLTGKLPAYLGGLRDLQSFTATNNRITGSVPPELTRCRNLTVCMCVCKGGSLFVGGYFDCDTHNTRASAFWRLAPHPLRFNAPPRRAAPPPLLFSPGAHATPFDSTPPRRPPKNNTKGLHRVEQPADRRAAPRHLHHAAARGVCLCAVRGSHRAVRAVRQKLARLAK